MSDTAVVPTQQEGWFWRFLARRRAKKLARAQEIVKDGKRFFEQKRAYDEGVALLLATPPRELIERALGEAGLPKDVTKVAGHWCTYAVPMGSDKHCFSARIEGISLQAGLTLKVSCGETRKEIKLWYQHGKWWTFYEVGDHYAKIPVHDIVLL